MKSLLSGILAFLILSLPTFAGSSQISSSKWIQDIDYLNQVAQKDFEKLFVKITPQEFEEHVEKLKKEVPNLSDIEITIKLAELVAKFEYGHTAVPLIPQRNSQHGYDGNVSFHAFPINFYWFSDGVFIQGIHKDYGEIVGAKVKRIGNLDVMDALDRVRPVVSIENESFFKAYGLLYLNLAEVLQAKGIIDQGKSLPLVVEKDGKEVRKRIELNQDDFPSYSYGLIEDKENWVSARVNKKDLPLYIHRPEKFYLSKAIPDSKAYYIRESAVRNQNGKSIADFYEEAMSEFNQGDYEKLIIDLRLNGGGNNYNNKDVVKHLIRSDKLKEKGSLVVIIGRRTFSAAQNLVNEIDNYTPAIFIGEPTAENVNFMGDTRTITLPNSKVNVRLSFAWWQDKPQWENNEWTTPDLYVEMSSQDYIFDKDPVLQTALDDNSLAFAISQKERLVEIFESGEKQKAEKELKSLINNPSYKYMQFESTINRIGYDYLNKKELDKAELAFWSNTIYYPNSANAWDSYAELQLEKGKLEESLKLYKKAIDLSEDGDFVYQNASAQITKIKENMAKD